MLVLVNLAEDPLITASRSARQLRRALTDAGFVTTGADDEWPRIIADVSPLGQPRIGVGSINTETADRLSAALDWASRTGFVFLRSAS